MRKMVNRLTRFLFVLCFLLISGCQGVQTTGSQEESFLNPGKMPARQDPFLGLQSQQAGGEQRVLVLALRFLDVEPSFSLEQIRGKIVKGLNRYVQEQSYGLTWVNADFRGWIQLPDPIVKYQVSPLNFEVDGTRVKKLIEDAMTAVEKEVDFSQYQHMILIPGAYTTPGKGYGMICYCANPGMLSGVRKNAGYVPLESEGGQPFRGGVCVAAENAHVGMFAHDFFHGLGGIDGEKRLVPCLYDFERQSDPSRLPNFKQHAIYMGPWDIMSHHFIERTKPPQGISSFTKIRLGWISPDQVVRVNPGSSQSAFLSPLSKKGQTLAVKIPLKQSRSDGWSHFYLVENRQPVGYDRILPDCGLLVLKVNLDAREGSGTVQVMDADPNSPEFSHATFKLGVNNRNAFIDKKNNVAIIPIWSEKGNQGVLVTTPEKSSNALQAALLIEELLQRFPEPRGEKMGKFIEECIASFKRGDYRACRQIAQPAQ